MKAQHRLNSWVFGLLFTVAACGGGGQGGPSEPVGATGGRSGSGGKPGNGGSGSGGSASGGSPGSSGGDSGNPGSGGSPGSSGGDSGNPGSGGSGAGGSTPDDASSGTGGAVPSDAADPGNPGGDPGGAETYVATLLSKGTGQRTDRRPIPVGLYDATANKTFVTWMGPGSDALVRAYDHATKTWSADKIAGKATFADKHNYPAMIKGRDGRLYIFYGCHNTPLRMTVSPAPGTIDGTWTDGPVAAAPEASYPAPIITSDGTMYVFTRQTRMKDGATDDRPFEFLKSMDNGKTWTKQLIIDNYPRTDNLTEIYNGKISYEPAHGDQKAKIHLSWTLAGGGPGKHEHDAFTRNIYYAYIDPTNDHLYSIAGKDLGTTIDDAEGEADCKALDTGCSNCDHQTGYQISVHYNDDGKPLILFGHFKDGLTAVRWGGTAWTKTVVTPALGEPRDINKIGPRSFQAFRGMGNTCQVFRTTDAGATWKQEATITAPHPVGRCHVIDNYTADVKIFMEANPEAGGGDTSTAKVTAGFVPQYKLPDAK
jgi:hypothetical protein